MVVTVLANGMKMKGKKWRRNKQQIISLSSRRIKRTKGADDDVIAIFLLLPSSVAYTKPISIVLICCVLLRMQAQRQNRSET